MASHGIPRVSATEAKSEQSKQKELQKIEQYKALVDQVNTKVKEKEYTQETLELVSKLLQWNPEYYTIWNHRRLVLQSYFSPNPASEDEVQKNWKVLSADLSFLIPLLIKFPKCYWIWNHRIWLLEQSTVLLPLANSRRLWTDELGLVTKMLHRDSRNFHGWHYRRYVVSELEQQNTSTSSEEQSEKTASSMTEEEFTYTTKMINTNLSNFSAWHYRGQLIPKLLLERKADDVAQRRMLDSEFELIQQALNTDPYDQSLWFYHNQLMSTLHVTAESSRLSIVRLLTTSELEAIYEREIGIILEILEDTDDCKWVYQALVEYTSSLSKMTTHDDKEASSNMKKWLARLRILDPLRNGKWDDLERNLKLAVG